MINKFKIMKNEFKNEKIKLNYKKLNSQKYQRNYKQDKISKNKKVN